MAHAERDRILSLLKELDIPFHPFTHEPVFTSEQAAAARQGNLHDGVKAMVCETERGIILALLAADRKLDLEKLAGLIKFKKIKFASKEKVAAHTGCEVGSVPPFGFPHPLPTYVDETVFDHENAEFNIGLHTESVRIKTIDLRKILPQKLLDFAQANE
ncbi:MAG: YbaK/EbsC family protein [archaeon]